MEEKEVVNEILENDYSAQDPDMESQDNEESGSEQPVDENEPTDIPDQSQQKNSKKEENLRELRERYAKAERDRDAALAYIASIQQKQQPAREEELADDELVEGRYLKKKLQVLENQIYTSTVESRLKANYNDFDSVVNDKSIRQLRERYPEIAESLYETPNLYNKAVSTYTLIKKLGLADGDASEQSNMRIRANAQKPRSANSVTPHHDSALANASNFQSGRLTEEQKKAIYKKAIELANSR